MHRRGIQESDEEDETYNDVVPDSPSSCEDSKISKPTPKKRFFWFFFHIFVRIIINFVQNNSLKMWWLCVAGGTWRRELYRFRLLTWKDLRVEERYIHRPIHGPGESTVKNRSKARLILGNLYRFLLSFFCQWRGGWFSAYDSLRGGWANIRTSLSLLQKHTRLMFPLIHAPVPLFLLFIVLWSN